jgi:hypothetical protein
MARDFWTMLLEGRSATDRPYSDSQTNLIVPGGPWSGDPAASQATAENPYCSRHARNCTECQPFSHRLRNRYCNTNYLAHG